MLQYEYRPGHAILVDYANLEVPEDNKNLSVPDPLEQQHIVQDSKSFSILENDEEIENDDDKAQQVIPDHIKHQGAEDTLNANQNDFEPKQEDKGAPQQLQGLQKDHEN